MYKLHSSSNVIILTDYKLDYKQYRNYYKHRVNFLALFGISQELKHRIGYNSETYSVCDAVGKRHYHHREKCRYPLGVIRKVDLGDGAGHKDAHQNQGDGGGGPGTIRAIGENNSDRAMHRAVTAEVSPVRPPAVTPAEDSTYVVTVLVPSIEPTTVPTASVVRAFLTCGRFPSLSSIFAFVATPISVPTVSKIPQTGM